MVVVVPDPLARAKVGRFHIAERREGGGSSLSNVSYLAKMEQRLHVSHELALDVWLLGFPVLV